MAAAVVVSHDELWRECVGWLTRCDVIRGDHRANWPDAKIIDLANILRDGVLLCNLLNVLESGSVDFKDVNQKPQMAQFLCLRNIQVFLRSCKLHFELKESDLFEPSMLFDLTNFHRVLCTLSKLSNCPKAQRKGIKGFSASPSKSKSQEDIYQSLQSIHTRGVQQTMSVVEPSWMQFTIKCPRIEDLKEDVYEDLCYVTFSPNLPEAWLGFIACMCGSDTPNARGQLEEHAEYGSYYSHIHNEEIYQDLCTIKRAPFQQLVTANSHALEKRDHVIKELLDTETKYVEVLTKLQKYFMRPLNALFRPDDMMCIFHGVQELTEIHSGFLSQLHKACSSDGYPKLSDVFLNWREKFLIYGSYCANLSTARRALQNICDRDAIINQEVIRCQQEYNNGRFKLRDIICVPMQRILKYHLLLQKLIEETPPSHKEYQALKRAHEAMLDVSGYINEVTKDSDHLVLLKQVQENILDWDMPADTQLHKFGHLLKDGNLKIKAHDDQKIKNRYVFIFDKLMILCKEQRGNPNQYSYRECLPLQEFRVEDVRTRAVLNREARWSYQWLLIRKNPQTVYTLYASTIDIKKKMISAILEALDNIEPGGLRNTNHKFDMQTFEKAVTCNRCSKFLKGLIYQGYKCKICGIAVHKECIAQSGRCGLPPALPPHPHHVDDALRDKLWFAGEMEREAATHILENRIDGTYLLRISPRRDEGRYALSLKTNDSVRHMRVLQKTVDAVEEFYLSESRFFKTILDLVRFYEYTSLRENFERLDANAKLLWPYRQIIAVVQCDFTPEERNHLQLRQGYKVIITSKDEPHEGWCKGKYKNHVGYFPRSCVHVLDEVTTEIE